jgi:hypothetical protein
MWSVSDFPTLHSERLGQRRTHHLLEWTAMETHQSPALRIEHVEGSFPAAFKLTRVSDGKSLSPVAIGSPYVFPVEGRPNSPLMGQLSVPPERFRGVDCQCLPNG